jgi:ATP-dependent helicase/nuclease subunit B
MAAGMTTRTHPRLYAIPVHCAFADALAAGLIREYGAEPLGLARGMILLPNSRAVTAVRDAFVRLCGGAALLPRLVTIGDSDLDASAGAALDRIDTEPMPPVIDAVRRRLLLAQLVQREAPQRAATLAEALRLADGLAGAIDALTYEDRGLADLLALADDDAAMAEHWADALHLFTRLSVLWPAELAARGLMDRAAARGAMLDRTVALWRNEGLPAAWVAAAGITTSAPAIAGLLRTIAFADGGMVVFPFLDTAMPDEQWAMLGPDPRVVEAGPDAAKPLETHAQYHLKLLLERMGAGRHEVAEWPDRSERDGPAQRGAFMTHVLAPARATEQWPDVPVADRKLPGVSALDCANPAEEALTIALAMREVLETPGKTAALVTPDRTLAAMVGGHLVRWGIDVDDSAGLPLGQTAQGALMLALVQAAAARFSPVALLTLLAHPLVRAGDGRLEWLNRVRGLDLALRGPTPPAGLAGIAMTISDDGLAAWWAEVSVSLAPLETDEYWSLVEAMAALLSVLDALAGDAVWAGAGGRALADPVERLQIYASEFEQPVTLADVAALLCAMMDDIPVRPPQGGHARLAIWGLIEARLQRADRMILGGMNEGQWPQPPSPDPWLSPGVRRRLGLPGLERQIGLSSHDFASALGAGEVLLTRAVRSGGAPTIASRLKLRIDALTGQNRPKAGATDFRAIAAALDAAQGEPRGARPEPNPPVELRGTKLSASSVDGLLADPFSWYAKSVLALYPLEPLEGEPDAAWRGTEVHDLLAHWLTHDGVDVDALIAATERRLAASDISPLLRAIWAPRLLAAVRWAGESIIAGRAEGRQPIISAVEKRGAINIDGITLSGKADRIDRLPDGSLAVVDYKTGSSPGKAQVAAGFALQLGLLGALAEGGAFAGADGRLTAFEYWRLNKKNDQFGWIDTPFYKKAEEGVQALDFVERCLKEFAKASTWLTSRRPFTAKLHPEYAPYSDYDQLMRLEEWIGTPPADAEDAS